MSKKRSVTPIAIELRKRFHKRVKTVYEEPVMNEKPSLRKWLLFMFLFLLIGLLLFYVLGTQSLFQLPVINDGSIEN